MMVGGLVYFQRKASSLEAFNLLLRSQEGGLLTKLQNTEQRLSEALSFQPLLHASQTREAVLTEKITNYEDKLTEANQRFASLETKRLESEERLKASFQTLSTAALHDINAQNVQRTEQTMAVWQEMSNSQLVHSAQAISKEVGLYFPVLPGFFSCVLTHFRAKCIRRRLVFIEFLFHTRLLVLLFL